MHIIILNTTVATEIPEDDLSPWISSDIIKYPSCITTTSCTGDSCVRKNYLATPLNSLLRQQEVNPCNYQNAQYLPKHMYGQGDTLIRPFSVDLAQYRKVSCIWKASCASRSLARETYLAIPSSENGMHLYL
jgi:hypothetical protein